jgi:hypothetical protein
VWGCGDLAALADKRWRAEAAKLALDADAGVVAGAVWEALCIEEVLGVSAAVARAREVLGACWSHTRDVDVALDAIWVLGAASAGALGEPDALVDVDPSLALKGAHADAIAKEARGSAS